MMNPINILVFSTGKRLGNQEFLTISKISTNIPH